MKVQYINPFISAAFQVLEMVLGSKPAKGTLSMRPSIFTSQQCNIITGVTGKVEGQVIYGMSLITADKIASHMLGQPVRTFDQLAASAIAELGNMVTGNAATLLAEAGFPCNITPPTIVRGTNVKMTTLDIPALVVPLCTDFGEIEITVSLQES
ncbi:predicted inhibitor of MCP methylation, CheC [Chthonomonas calidirosea]|jgi:chemotaxis protein CheX|uniref:Predicted inhibitor of MCP methylation, homolog of CheC n=1 Tax=Chthonomonas calidirosea (strain DSM 23976 / ICMP 18418 / T49) TaxID=1303518 RepID=S0EZK3_CHTCT|nr:MULTISPECIES: chemotaxis protein CheX [Chthonomonas]CCW36356.1 Predicted inhibitor of MCP methylation, homolog of CheC [Chthonomonas calidirosea T49]CEK16504.1 predicted inhibitor of MCP methylation, CheC [Chthonomonas calidirosea]CEK16505.1 predicted inhibitor of MCP methylation, CheC [Chthonomonas calidirosea]CEK17575.1 predicted inhibitor of MCP methylation, CheC [Chthonomonas calidirosea]HLH78852.1 chemotaxis protein CheX [Chthonomonas sp.]